MLGNHDAMATLAVKDLEGAKAFYGGTLGLQVEASMEPGAVVYRSGSSKMLVYASEFAGTNAATAVSWTVGDDLARLVRDLKAKGIRFEHYDDLPGVTREGDIHLIGPLKTVWFKDPDGNILNLGDQ